MKVYIRERWTIINCYNVVLDDYELFRSEEDALVGVSPRDLASSQEEIENMLGPFDYCYIIKTVEV